MKSSISLSAAALIAVAAAQSSSSACSTTITPSYAAPSVAAGYSARIIANGLTKPRGLMFDSSGHLLVIQQGYGLTSLSLNDDGISCVSVASKKDIVRDTALNHGLEMSPDGRTLYASTTNDLFAWPYDAAQQANTSAPRVLVTGMLGSDHSTRTLTLSRKVPGQMLISRGSFSNLDYDAADITSGHSQIRAYNLNNVTSPYNYDTDGTRIAWGVRNSVGVAEHPTTGGIFSVENSVDNAARLGVDVHQNNPGEEMNYHGTIANNTFAGQGQNYGYPYCFSAWNVSALPSNNGIQVGTPFAIGQVQNATVNDTNCRQNTIAARITFPAHWAPLDIKFNSNGNTAWVTSHGSWNRDAPDGYLLFQVAFNNGMPTEPANSTRAVIPILSNRNNSACPDGCFRPVGLAWDSKGRLFMSSDSTGEIYMITKTDGTGVDQVAAATASASAPVSTPTSTTAAGHAPVMYRIPQLEVLCAAFGVGCLMM